MQRDCVRDPAQSSWQHLDGLQTGFPSPFISLFSSPYTPPASIPWINFQASHLFRLLETTSPPSWPNWRRDEKVWQNSKDPVEDETIDLFYRQILPSAKVKELLLCSKKRELGWSILTKLMRNDKTTLFLSISFLQYISDNIWSHILYLVEYWIGLEWRLENHGEEEFLMKVTIFILWEKPLAQTNLDILLWMALFSLSNWARFKNYFWWRLWLQVSSESHLMQMLYPNITGSN